MTCSWLLDGVFPLLAHIPSTLPWWLATKIGRERGAERRQLLRWLEARFAQIFPQASPSAHAQWARAHLDMLAQEMMDAMAFHRLGKPGGPAIAMTGFEHIQRLRAQGKGFVLVLNHFDRQLAAPVMLAHRGIHTNVLTMPVLDNPELDGANRRFLLRKVRGYAEAAGGEWRTTDQGLGPVLEGLRAGQGWVIWADAWRPGFKRLRSHPFLGGRLTLPTGIERMAASTGVPLLYAATHSDGMSRLRVVIELLPEDPRQAIDAVIARLERDVMERPWAWWCWGQWDQMWTPSVEEASLEQH